MQGLAQEAHNPSMTSAGQLMSNQNVLPVQGAGFYLLLPSRCKLRAAYAAHLQFSPFLSLAGPAVLILEQQAALLLQIGYYMHQGAL